ncbi:MAG: glycerol-3-phosphate 1-O-acyltransferase PlsY [Phycisphaerales bacterium]|nr:glycerol-3-phosphate 1-O-acyltransferase PlsY [Phycisphaerales bacterium]
MTWSLLIATAFLAGSIPFGLLIARVRGIDIRKHGSGNIGATNVLRVLGPGAGALCFLLDMLKGLVPTALAGWRTGAAGWGAATYTDLPQTQAWLWLGVMAASVLGHMFSPWVGFRGGKGVATGFGAMLGMFPYLSVPAVAALAVWIGVAAATRYAGLASVAAALSLPVCVVAWAAARAVLILRVRPADMLSHRNTWVPFFIVASLLGAMVIVKHRGNLRRVFSGTESRIGQRKPPPVRPDRT